MLDGVSTPGAGLMVTAVVVKELTVHPGTAAVTVKVPLYNVVAEPMMGFCAADEKLLGPTQE